MSKNPYTDILPYNKDFKNVSLMIGKFHPPHVGHAYIISKLPKNAYIGIVEGCECQDTPFPIDIRMKMLKQISFYNQKIIKLESGWIADIAMRFRQQRKELTYLYCGKDRIEKYKSVIDSFNDYVDRCKRLEIELIETDRLTSGSYLRYLIETDQFELFKVNTPQVLWEYWCELKEYVDEFKR